MLADGLEYFTMCIGQREWGARPVGFSLNCSVSFVPLPLSPLNYSDPKI